MVYALVENGFEESELLVPVDLLRRGGVEVCLVGVSEKTPASTRNVKLVVDKTFDEVDFSDMEMLFLPGGQPGVDNLKANPRVMELIKNSAGHMPIGAICAAPILLGSLGLLKGRRATCYPGCESELHGATYDSKNVIVDGSYITGKAAGAAFEFGFTLLATLKGTEVAERVASGIYYKVSYRG